jgi:hypothetical protein
MPGFIALEYGHGTVLQTVGAITCKAGIVAGGAGAARDSLLYGAHIALNGTAVTLTIAGLADDTGVARNWVLSGQVTVDSWFPFNDPACGRLRAATGQIPDKRFSVSREVAGKSLIVWLPG